MELAGRVALVTGGAVRIGRAICEALARERCAVVIHYRQSRKEAGNLARAIRSRGVEAWPLCGRLDSEPDCRRLVERAWAAAGRLDVLVNNAAVFHKDGLRTTTARRLEEEMRVNLYVPVYLTRRFTELAEGGRIINLLDRRVAGVEAGCLPYLLSKKGLAEFTRIAALELAPAFTMNAVAPGPVLAPPGRGAKCLREVAGRMPLPGTLSAAAVAEGVVALLRLDGVTGQTLFVDGGQHLLSS